MVRPDFDGNDRFKLYPYLRMLTLTRILSKIFDISSNCSQVTLTLPFLNLRRVVSTFSIAQEIKINLAQKVFETI